MPLEKTLNEFNRGLNTRTAIYTPFAQAIPNVPVIDTASCIKMKTGKCGICEKFCQAGAIDYTQTDEIVTEQYGATSWPRALTPLSWTGMVNTPTTRAKM